VIKAQPSYYVDCVKTESLANDLFDLTDGVFISVTLNTQAHQVKISGQHKTTDGAVTSRWFSVRPNKILNWAQSGRPEPPLQ